MSELFTRGNITVQDWFGKDGERVGLFLGDDPATAMWLGTANHREAEIDDDGPDLVVAEANAKLWAAAADLYAALEAWIEADDNDLPDCDDDEPIGTYGDGRPLPLTFGHYRRAKAALAKARGES